MVARIGMPDSALVAAALEHARTSLARIPDDGWNVPAADLDWTCRETMMHILDDLGAYAMQLSGVHGHQGYPPLMEFAPVPGRIAGMFWPEEAGGTRAVLDCLDAVGGLLVAVVASVPADRTGRHPYGDPDRSALAGMGIVELLLHTHDILCAHHLDHRPPAHLVAPCLDRIFAHAPRSGDPWQDLLSATGRTPQTRGRPWRWNSAAVESTQVDGTQDEGMRFVSPEQYAELVTARGEVYVNRIDVRESDDDHTLILGTADARVLSIHLRYDGGVDEVTNAAGVTAPGPSAWTLIDHVLSLEFGPQTAATLGLPRDYRIRLDVDDDGIRRVRVALLDILSSACYLVDTADGRLTG